jgi:hypothetical protein
LLDFSVATLDGRPTVAMMEDDDGGNNHVVVVVVRVVVMELVASTCTTLCVMITITCRCENLVDS